MSSVKYLIKRIPIINSIGKRVITELRIRSDKNVLKQLSHTSNPKAEGIKNAINRIYKDHPQYYNKFVARIEGERERLLQRYEPLVDDSIGVGVIYDKNITIHDACRASKGPKQSLFLYYLVKELQPKKVVELGTNVGISAAFIATALQENEEKGSLITLDVSPYRQKLAKDVHKNLGLKNISYIEGFFSDTLYSTLKKVGRIDLAFIDGDHQYEPTMKYFEVIYEFASNNAIFVFDDIRWSNGMKMAWSKLQDDDRFCLVVDLYTMGICVLTQDNSSRRIVTPPMYYVFS